MHIIATPKEIAALILAIQERHGETDMKILAKKLYSSTSNRYESNK